MSSVPTTAAIEETRINLISEKTRLEGKMVFERSTRIHGSLVGEVLAGDGSLFIVGETGMIQGNIRGDEIVIDGFVKGDVTASKRVAISSSGRLVGNIEAPSISIDFGAYFEGSTTMPK